MILNESNFEEAALTWFHLRRGCCGQVGELGYAYGHGPQMAPGEPAAERDSFGEVVLVGRLREALRRLQRTILQFPSLAALRDTLSPKLLSGEIRAGDAMDRIGKGGDE